MKKQRKPRPGKTKKPGAAVAAHSPRAVPRLVKRTVLLWVGYMLAALAVFGGMKDFLSWLISFEHLRGSGIIGTISYGPRCSDMTRINSRLASL
jgi:hypothetical protein